MASAFCVIAVPCCETVDSSKSKSVVSTFVSNSPLIVSTSCVTLVTFNSAVLNLPPTSVSADSVAVRLSFTPVISLLIDRTSASYLLVISANLLSYAKFISFIRLLKSKATCVCRFDIAVSISDNCCAFIPELAMLSSFVFKPSITV